MSKNRPFFVQYDVPEIRGRPVFTNPSAQLWAAGAVRITLSCWLIMESDLHRVYPLLNRMSNFGVRWYTVPFDVSATEQLRQMALENIRREINEHIMRARQTREEAETQFDDESDTDYAKRRRAYLATARSIEKRVTEMIARVSGAAKNFGITERDLRTSEAVGEVELMAGNMRQRAASFAQMHGILTREGPAGAARALASGELPPTFGAEMLSDLGTEEANDVADDVRASFGDFFG